MDSPSPSDELYPLDDAAIEFLTPRRQQVKVLNAEINAVLTYFLMQHKLEGSWMLAENDRELVFQSTPPVTGQRLQQANDSKSSKEAV